MNNLFKIWKENKPVVNAWLSIPNSFTAEAFGKMGWDAITIDMQHGQSDYSSSIPMLQALSSSSSTPMVRVPWYEPGIIMRMLDLGVLGIIAPMINTKEDCEKFVSYCYYPPIGQRSFGPMRAQLIHGSSYFEKANENILSFAMIETQQAVDNLDDILSVPNLTGVYIGPADMSSSYGMKPQFDVKEDPVFSNIKLNRFAQSESIVNHYKSIFTKVQLGSKRQSKQLNIDLFIDYADLLTTFKKNNLTQDKPFFPFQKQE